MENYRYDIADLTKVAQASAKANQDPLATAVKAIMARIKKRPLGYLSFGVYWYAVKRALNNAGQNLGDNTNQMMADSYGLHDDLLTLIAGWRCSDENIEQYLYGTRETPVSDDADEVYSLYDPDMEPVI